ncbi:hypothetical protein V8E36_003350 [Tilletia maclaganii]
MKAPSPPADDASVATCWHDGPEACALSSPLSARRCLPARLPWPLTHTTSAATAHLPTLADVPRSSLLAGRCAASAAVLPASRFNVHRQAIRPLCAGRRRRIALRDCDTPPLTTYSPHRRGAGASGPSGPRPSTRPSCTVRMWSLLDASQGPSFTSHTVRAFAPPSNPLGHPILRLVARIFKGRSADHLSADSPTLSAASARPRTLIRPTSSLANLHAARYRVSPPTSCIPPFADSASGLLAHPARLYLSSRHSRRPTSSRQPISRLCESARFRTH